MLCAIVLTPLGGFLSAGPSDANGIAEKGVFLVSVFDCYVPIPNEFVLQTRDPSRVTLSLRSRTNVTRIVISDYKEPLDNSFVRTDSRTVSGLTLEAFSVSNSFRKDVNAARLHDGKQQMFIYGGTDRLVESLMRGCEERKRGTLYEE
jgi:hypothetical protein